MKDETEQSFAQVARKNGFLASIGMKRLRRQAWPLAFACLLAFMGTAVAVERFALRINDVSGIDEPWPLLGGLPFPEGALHDPARVRVVDDAGHEVPAQVDVAAKWRDGSVRWAHVGFTASPQGAYTVEFGPGVVRAAPAQALSVRMDADGGLSVDTGPAKYTFLADALLPDRLAVDGVDIFKAAGGGAYLVDNYGRTSRVMGPIADVTNTIVKQGAARAVLRRDGWYVTSAGDRVARARAWFYFAAGSPYVRIQHSLVFTEDTNKLWVRDYGLEFKTSASPRAATFAISQPGAEEDHPPIAGGAGRRLSDDQIRDLAELFHAGLCARGERTFDVEMGADDVYMLQETYPHLTERDFRAVIARAPVGNGDGGNMWSHNWLKLAEVAGDWGEADCGDYALAVLTPQLAQRFPKEIAFGPDGARVALWSSRSGRELDFRAVTLVNEYWRRWAIYSQRPSGEHAAMYVAGQPSNAQGAARTHDVWLLPRVRDVDAALRSQRARAASYPPLLLADPAWLTATQAMGWPMHPRDDERFADAEAVLDHIWEQLLGTGRYNAGVRRTGFIEWGRNVNLHLYTSWFRIARGSDYGIGLNAWGLYARSGERKYYEYASRYNQFFGDWEFVNWSGGDKYIGEFVSDQDNNLPFYWGRTAASNLRGNLHDGSGHPARRWLPEYYLTGNEHLHALVQMNADAYRERGDAEIDDLYIYHVNGLSAHYAHSGDPVILRMVREQAHRLIDLDNPVGLSDANISHGLFYKTSAKQGTLYRYYRATGDEKASEALLRSLDYKYRFDHMGRRGGPSGGRGPFNRSSSLYLYGTAYMLTGRPAYLRIVNEHMRQFCGGPPGVTIMTQVNPFSGVPAALAALAAADEPIAPYPLAETDDGAPMAFETTGGESVTMQLYVRTSGDVPASAPVTPRLLMDGSVTDAAAFEIEHMFQTRNPSRQDQRRWAVRMTLPADAPAGRYLLEVPQAGTIVVLESNVPVQDDGAHVRSGNL